MKFKILYLLLLLWLPTLSAQESLCANVKIEIKQELTLERQAFEATMKINNGLTDADMTDVAVEVIFQDTDGNPVLASSDPDNVGATFFIRVNDLENISDVEGGGSVPKGSSSTIKWLIIPAPGAGGELNGVQYNVGAKITYKLRGEEQDAEVVPDTITVNPIPELELDYFLPSEVYGDEPFTTDVIEEEVPFSLGVRVSNVGFGDAVNLKIESGQPKIIENDQGLLIGFKLHSSQVNDQPVANSLLVNFGNIAPQTAGMARWQMTSSLSGQFTEFTATFSHADALGGQLTSLLKEVRTHFLVRDVLVDSPGKDEVREFLSHIGENYTLHESDGSDTAVSNLSSSASLIVGTLTRPSHLGYSYVQVPSGDLSALELEKVVRNDGKLINSHNAWISRKRNKQDGTYAYYLNIFDWQTEAATEVSYDFTFKQKEGSLAPVLQFIQDVIVQKGEMISFITRATAPGEDAPLMGVEALNIGASFSDDGNGFGTFNWTPSRAGVYPYTFTAEANGQKVSRAMQIIVTDTTPSAVQFAEANLTLGEGDGSADLTVSLSQPSADEVTVDYAITGGSATTFVDYTLTDGTVTFAPGETSKTLSLLLNDDDREEITEDLVVTLSNVVNAALGTNTELTVEIIDNDQQGNLLVQDGDKLLLFEKGSGAFLADFVEFFTLDDVGSFTYGLDGYIYVSGKSTGVILRFDAADGQFVDEFSAVSELGLPEKVLFGPDGQLYVINEQDATLISLNVSDGTYDATLVEGLLPGADFTFTPAGTLLVSDETVLREFDLSGQQLGNDIAIVSLNSPEGLLFGPDGLLYIANTASHNILQVDLAAGQLLKTFTDANFAEPTDLAFNPAGHLFITNRGSSAVFELDLTSETLVNTDITLDYEHTAPGHLSFIDLAPEIKIQPTDFDVVDGATARLEVVADGTATLTYQWQQDGIDIPGATAPVYSFIMDSANVLASYQCVVSNYKGSVTSSAAAAVQDGAYLIGLTDGDTFEITDINLSWNDVSATEYQVLVGSSAGASDIESHTGLSSTDVILSNLTFNGGTIFVRLRSLIAGQFIDNDYEFTTEVVNHTVTFLTDTNGTITPAAAQSVIDGDSTAPVTAIPNTGYDFASWSNGVLTPELTVDNVREDLTFTAQFSVKQYNVNFLAGANGTLVGDSTQIVDYGSSTSSVTAVADTGYAFVQWSDGDTSNPRELSNVTSHVTLTATFVLKQYSVSFVAGANGTLVGDISQTVDHGGSSSSVTAVADTGYSFVQWSDGDTSNPRELSNVTSDVTLTATFTLKQCTVSFVAGANGIITGDSVQTVDHGGSSSSVTAVPDVGYEFVQWSDGDTSNPRELSNVTSDVTLTAEFSLKQYVVSFVAGANGIITGASVQTVDHGGSSSSVTAIADPGYEFLQWSDGNTSAERTLADITADVTLTATFALKQYTVSFVAGANGTLVGDSTQVVDHGSSTSLVTAVPDSGYTFVRWSDGDENAERILSNVTADVTLSAEFTALDPEFTVEIAQLQLNHEWHTVELTKNFTDPVVIVGPPTFNGSHPVVVRVRNKTASSFEIRLEEWDYLDGEHVYEDVTYMVVERGTHVLPNGKVLLADSVNLTNESYATVSLGESLVSSPIVLSTVITDNEASAVTTRVRNVDTDSFEIKMQEEELNADIHATETVDWIAIEEGVFEASGFDLEVRSVSPVDERNLTVDMSGYNGLIGSTHTIAGSDTGALRVKYNAAGTATLNFQEEQSKDDEQSHANETAGIILVRYPITFEYGQVTADHTWQQVHFNETFVDPIVVVSPHTANDAAASVVRVRNVTSSGFEVRIQNWDYLPEEHALEDLYFFAIEKGRHVLPTGQEIEAGSIQLQSKSKIEYSKPMKVNPVLLSSVVSENDAAAVTRRVTDVNQSSFLISLQEEEFADGLHAEETVHYISFEPGSFAYKGKEFVLGVLDPVNSELSLALASDYESVIASDHTLNGGDTGALRMFGTPETGIQLKFEEEQSRDVERSHVNETAGYLLIRDYVSPELEFGTALVSTSWQTINFSGTYTKPIVVTGPAGSEDVDPVTVRIRNITETSFEICLQEWDYQDNIHTPEKVSYMVVERGTHTLPNGKKLIADSIDLRDTFFVEANFPITMFSTPVVISSVTSYSGTSPVVTRIKNVTDSSFEIRMQEEENNNQLHSLESVDYVAIEPGSYTLGAYELLVSTFAPVDEIVRVLDIKGYDHFVADDNTQAGGDTVNLRINGEVSEGPLIYLEEEMSKDSEILHFDEEAGFIFAR